VKNDFLETVIQLPDQAGYSWAGNTFITMTCC